MTMTNAETIAQALRDFSTLIAEDVKDAETPQKQEELIELVSIMRRIARLVANMTFEDAKDTIRDFDEPERSIIMDLLGKKGIFF